MGSTGMAVGGWPRAWTRRNRGRTVALTVALVVAAGAVVALVAGGGLSNTDEALVGGPGLAGGDVATDSGRATLADEQAATDGDAASASRSGAAVAGAPVPPSAVPGGEARVVKHAELSIEVAEGSLNAAFDRVASVADRQGGFVVSSSTSSFDVGEAGAELTLRVPAEQFDAARTDLVGVGEMRSVQVGGEDVTARLVDLDARLRALRAEEAALIGLLGQAGNVGEVLAVREQMSATRLEIEQLAAQQASLDDRASLSTLRVSLSEPGASPVRTESESSTGLARSFERALDASVAVAGGMVVVLGYLLPLVVLGLLARGGRRLARLRRRPA